MITAFKTKIVAGIIFKRPLKFKILEDSRTMFKILADDDSFPEINEVQRSLQILNHPSRQYSSLLERNISRLQIATQMLLGNYTTEQFKILKGLVNQTKKTSDTYNIEKYALSKCLSFRDCNKRLEFSNYKQQRFKRIITQPSISAGKF